MKNIVIGLALLALLVLTGCAGNDMSTVTQIEQPDGSVVTKTDNVNNSDIHSWAEASKVHDRAENKRIADMTASLMKAKLCKDCDPVAQAWSQAFIAVTVAYGDNFAPTPFLLEKPKSWIDVSDTAVGGVTSILKTGMWVYGGVELGKALVDGAGDTINATQGDGGTISDSFNKPYTEAHATTASGDPITNQDNSKGDDRGGEELDEDEEFVPDDECSAASHEAGLC